MTKTVILTVGAPASGKSTWARNMARENAGQYVVVCRDDIRKANGFPGLGDKAQEALVTKIQRGIIETALLDGITPIVADTNINKQFRKHLIKFCHEHGAEVQLVLFYRDLDTLLSWNDGREDEVPEDVIRRMHQQFTKQINDGEFNEVILPVPTFAPYEHKDTGTEIIVCDIDHTIALCDGIRSPYDYTKVGLDAPNEDVIAVVRSLAEHYPIFFVSGRDGGCREDTEAWIRKHVIDDFTLLMRPAGNVEPDYIIKNRIADQDLIPNYNIRVWIDDRLQVIRHVRSRGITVLDVNGSRF